MSLNKEKRAEIKKFIIKNVKGHPNDIVKIATERFGLSRQTVNHYINQLIDNEVLESEGATRNKKYFLKKIKFNFYYKNVKTLKEDKIWRDDILPKLPVMKNNVKEICHYGFTEMVNNVIDHSESDILMIYITLDSLTVEFVISDEGVGIFNKIMNYFDLDDPHHAILELSKGKMTTDPQKHTGEGIFFTSRAFDDFKIVSGKMGYTIDATSEMLLDCENFNGTTVWMSIALNSNESINNVFTKYTDSPDDYGFSKTVIAMNLALYEGESLVSRSQAKRIYARFEVFKEIILDFKGIESIGQAFADEMFRVFVQAHPQVMLFPINTMEQVDKMIKRAKAGLDI